MSTNISRLLLGSTASKQVKGRPLTQLYIIADFGCIVKILRSGWADWCEDSRLKMEDRRLTAYKMRGKGRKTRRIIGRNGKRF